MTEVLEIPDYVFVRGFLCVEVKDDDFINYFEIDR